jgi:hypothetical protein
MMLEPLVRVHDATPPHHTQASHGAAYHHGHGLLPVRVLRRDLHHRDGRAEHPQPAVRLPLHPPRGQVRLPPSPSNTYAPPLHPPCQYKHSDNLTAACIGRITKEFLEWLKKPLEIRIYASPYVVPSKGACPVSAPCRTQQSFSPTLSQLVTRCTGRSSPPAARCFSAPRRAADKITTRNPKVLEKLGFAHLITSDMAMATTMAGGILSPMGGGARLVELETMNEGGGNGLTVQGFSPARRRGERVSLCAYGLMMPRFLVLQRWRCA